MSEDTTDTNTLDCIICHNEIDTNDPQGYMLAPCDHIFHRQCLEQWMDVKVRMLYLTVSSEIYATRSALSIDV